MRGLTQKVNDHCSILIQKKEFGLVQETCVEYLILWNRFGKDIIYDTNESSLFSFESTPFTILVSIFLLIINIYVHITFYVFVYIIII